MPEKLDAPSSPEQLDQCVRLISPLGWLAVLALAAITGAIVVWGFLGKLPNRINGIGFLIAAEERLFPVVASETASVQRIHVAVGEHVDKGQLLISLVRPQLELELDQAMRTAAELDAELARHTAVLREDLARQKTLTQEHQAILRRKVEARQEHKAFLARLLSDQLEQLKHGYIRRAEVEQTRVDLHSVEAELLSLESETVEEEKRRADYTERQEESFAQLRDRAQDAHNRVDAVRLRMREAHELRSPIAGVVTEVASDTGKQVTAGQELVVVEEPSDDLAVEAFVRLIDGKRIEPGMPVQVAVSSVEVEEYGTILGRVRSVAPQPASRAQLLNRFENQGVVDLITQAGPPVSVEIELSRDPETRSGFRWSSSGGPPLRLSGGTLVSAGITYGQRRPVDFVIPLMRIFGRDSDG